jgi:DinB family protein
MRYVALGKEEREKLLARLGEMPGFLEAALGGLSAAEAVLPGPDGTFSPVEQCWHLADLEREGFGARIVRLLSEEDPVLPDFDGLRVAQERGYKRLSLADGLRAFRVAREGTLAMLRSIRALPEWERSGRQEGVGKVALCDLPAMIAEHDASHRGEIEAWMKERHRA